MPDTAGLGDLWIRASRIRETCSISVHVVAVPPGWMVRVEQYKNPDNHADGFGGHVLEALAAALNRAEAMGLGPASVDMTPVTKPHEAMRSGGLPVRG